jgi:hypothetical protein
VRGARAGFDGTFVVRIDVAACSSFFQSVCVLGYCVFPLNIATLVCMLASVVVSHILLRMLIVTLGFLWSTRGAWQSQLSSCPAMNVVLICLLSTATAMLLHPASVCRVHVQVGAAQAQGADGVPGATLLPLHQLDGAHPVSLAT